MKWTTLRLNMLPITAVEIQYACQTLTNIHNALVDTCSKQSLIQVDKLNLKPLFTPNQNFLSPSQPASKPSSLAQPKKKPLQQQLLQPQPLMTYEKLFQQYQKLKQQMYSQSNELKNFYMRNSQDESSSLFHMLRLKLQRCLFDCNFQQNQTKKVMTKAQEEVKYNQIAKNFQSNQTNPSKAKLKSIQETDQEFVESCETFKTQNYTGYENQSIQATKQQFLNFDDSQYEELFYEDKMQNKKQTSKSTLNLSLEKKNNSMSNMQRNSKQATKKLSSSKIFLKKQPNSQMTIATLNERQTSSEKITLTNLQNEEKSYKNLKILTNNNSSLKNTNKPSEVLSNFSKQSIIMKQNSTSQNLHQLNQKNKNQKSKSYAVLNQKKEQQNKMNSNNLHKQKGMTVNQGNKNLQLQKHSFKKSEAIISTKNAGQKNSNGNKVNHEFGKKDITISSIPPSPKQQTLNTTDPSDLKEILMSKGSELRFTIKMSREQYKSLLELKSKMNEKSSN